MAVLPREVVMPRLPSFGNPALMEAAKALSEGVDAYVSGWSELAKSTMVPPSTFTTQTVTMLPDPARKNILEWPGFSAAMLQRVARENLGPKLIIQQRCADVDHYSRPSQRNWQPGWRIVMAQENESPTAQDRRDIDEAMAFVENCGIPDKGGVRGRDAAGRKPFSEYLELVMRDTLRFAWMTTWTSMNALGEVIAFSAMPAGNIRRCGPKGFEGNPELFAVLVDDKGSPITPFTRDELIIKVRNPRTDEGVNNHGYAEIEMAYDVIMGLDNAIKLNVMTFDQNAIPNGMLLLKGDGWTDKPVDAMARMLMNMKRGISKAWGMPAIGLPEDSTIEVLNFMDMKGQDVRYRDHMNMMAGFWCSLFCFPVDRFGYHASGYNKDSEPALDGATSSVVEDDIGRPALLQQIEEVINPYIVQSRWPRLRFMFTAKHPLEDAREYEARQNARTYGERRKQADLPNMASVLPDGYDELGDLMDACPTDANLVQPYIALATLAYNEKHGLSQKAGDTDAKGGITGEKKDPAKSLQHGHVSGVRRDSAGERSRAARG